MATYIKILIIAVLLLIPTYLMFKFVFDSAYDNPLPVDPAVTLEDFFTCLQDKPDDDYFRARELLAPPMKMPVLWDSGKIDYINGNFERIRNYLIERAGSNFAAHLQFESGPYYFMTKFPNGIILRCTIGTKWGLDEKTHYTVEQILDFPQDYFPTLGVEQRNRELNQIMDSVTKSNTEIVEEVDDLQSALALRSGESPSVRLQRLINSFHYSYMLDVRHALFDAILQDFPDDPATKEFLREITREDYDVALHLKNQAQKILATQAPPIIK